MYYSRFLYNIALFYRIRLNLSPITSTSGCYFCFGSVSSFILFIISPLISSSIEHLLTSFSVLSFWFLFCSWGSQGKNAGSGLSLCSSRPRFLTEAPTMILSPTGQLKEAYIKCYQILRNQLFLKVNRLDRKTSHYSMINQKI